MSTELEFDSNPNKNKMERTPKLQENHAKSTVQTRPKCVKLNEPTPPDLERIHHEPSYELPILTNDKYRHLDANKRAKLMSEYLTKISNIRANLAKHSLSMAPRPKPILPSTKYPDSSLIEPDTGTSRILEESQETEENPQRNTYVNRFGRQVKRKVYTEETDGDVEPEPLQNSDDHQFEFSDDVKITMSNVVKETEMKDESSLQVYSPLRGKKRLPRAERLFENLLRHDEKKREQEIEMEAFEKTLMQADEDFDENRNGKTVEEPVSASQSINRKRRLISVPQDLDKITVVAESSNEDSKVKKFKDMKKKKNETECPICYQKFPTNKVEEHASTCGETIPE